jgi:hypothetical protein
VDLSQCMLFFYELYEGQFVRHLGCWDPVNPDLGYPDTMVELPPEKHLEGFDVVAGCGGGCSPLSCNSLAKTIPVNDHCLLPSLGESVRLIEAGAFENSEPGPLRTFAVYSCPWPN